MAEQDTEQRGGILTGARGIQLSALVRYGIAVGIGPQDQERIFMVFQRLHHQEPYPKPGIRLAICKKIIERHGGKTWVESLLGQGATFLFTLPAREALPPPSTRSE